MIAALLLAAALGNTVAPAPICTLHGWCWSSPWPQGHDLVSVSGSSGADVWAIARNGSSEGQLLHWDGRVWSGNPFAPPLLNAVFVARSGDGWAVGDRGTILRWDGREWRKVPSGTAGDLNRVWKANTGDVFASGRGVLLRWNGDRWVVATSPPYSTVVWASGRRDAWALTDEDAIEHWDGAAWRRIRLPSGSSPIYSVWGTGPRDVWAVGNACTALHWNGRFWTNAHKADLCGDGEPDPGLGVLWGNKDEVWAVGRRGAIHRWDGRRWLSVVESDAKHEDLLAIWGSAARDVWAVGRAGAIVHWDGRSWTHLDVRLGAGYDGIGGTGPDDLWAVGALGTIVHWNGSNWSISQSDTSNDLHAVLASANDDAWTVGESATILHWDGSAWSEAPTPTSRDATITDVWGSGPRDIWIAAGAVFHWNGAAWEQSLKAPASGLWGTGPTDVWVAGSSGIHSWNGSAWSLASATPATGLWGTGTNDIWAYGREGTLLHWNGKGWSDIPNPARTPSDPLHRAADVLGVFARGVNDVWIVADGVKHWNGSAWTTELEGNLTGIWGTSSDLWMVGDGGAILRRLPSTGTRDQPPR